MLDRVAVNGHAPPGWPPAVPPPDAAGWMERAVAWLLDQGPAEYRTHTVLRRHPLALAHLVRYHVVGALHATDEATAGVRSRLADRIPAPAIEETLAVLDCEQARLLSVLRGVDLVGAALAGVRRPPRL